MFERATTLNDTVPVYSVIELRMKGSELDIDQDSACFTATIDRQTWPGYYLGNGLYAVRYSPKAPAVLSYTVSSGIKNLTDNMAHSLLTECGRASVVRMTMPLAATGSQTVTIRVFEGPWQGAGLIRKQRHEILEDWAERWNWLKDR